MICTHVNSSYIVDVVRLRLFVHIFVKVSILCNFVTVYVFVLVLLDTTRSEWTPVCCVAYVAYSFFSTRPRHWLGKTFPKWPVMLFENPAFVVVF